MRFVELRACSAAVFRREVFLLSDRALREALDDAWRHAAETQAAVTLAFVRIENAQVPNDLGARVHCALRWAMARNRDILLRCSEREFAVIFPHTTAGGAAYIIGRIEAVVAALDAPAGCDRIEARVGYAALRAAGDATPQLLIEQAHAALHQAKPRSRAHD